MKLHVALIKPPVIGAVVMDKIYIVSSGGNPISTSSVALLFAE